MDAFGLATVTEEFFVRRWKKYLKPRFRSFDISQQVGFTTARLLKKEPHELGLNLLARWERTFHGRHHYRFLAWRAQVGAPRTLQPTPFIIQYYEIPLYKN